MFDIKTFSPGPFLEAYFIGQGYTDAKHAATRDTVYVEHIITEWQIGLTKFLWLSVVANKRSKALLSPISFGLPYFDSQFTQQNSLLVTSIKLFKGHKLRTNSYNKPRSQKIRESLQK